MLVGTTMTHVLMVLFQVWSVRVLAFIKYTSVRDIKDATYVLVVPRSFKGKSSIIPLERPQSGDKSPFFLFQKHKYIAELAEDKKNQDSVLFRKLRAPTTEPIQHYISARGFSSELAVEQQLQLYGTNEFSIPQPNFVEMFKQQLLEPLTVFQVFSVCLYMLDEYWQYSLFTLTMILMFEGVTVLSRLKNLQTLRGMGNQTREIYVYRLKEWAKITSDQLVPGDIASIKRETEGDNDNMVACDCLLLNGSTVMNEATLTGESVPQMKESIGSKMSAQDLAEVLDMKSEHKVHVLFGGTTIMQNDITNVKYEDSTADGGATKKLNAIPNPPDKGCTVFVLRTGFSSSQGKLVRMIEFSSGKVTGSTWDAYGLAFLLLIFALLSSGYVLRHGIAQKGKITFELLLRCVLIITSVIPAELPMQTAMAVNSALLSLVKLSIFCTEPFRISLAGKVDICLFDKTGTLTTDQLTAVGVVCEDSAKTGVKAGKDEVIGHVPMIAGTLDTTLVLAGCQSLVQIDGKMIGDPVEEASIRAIDFTYDGETRRCQPKPDLERADERRWGSSINQKDVFVQIVHRNHFASKLQRMSVVAKVHLGDRGLRYRSLVKGSPEAIANLMSKEDIPAWYWATYQSLARKGMRVLALAYKDIEGKPSEQEIAHKPRSWAESDLKFAGFAVFQCLVRKDSGEILKMLKDSSHQVSMITGDATLTAVHVSREVGIVTRPALILTEAENTGGLVWTRAEDDSVMDSYKSSDVRALVKKYDLCVNGKTLAMAGEVDDLIWKVLNDIRVFARMTPELKEKVLTCLKKNGHHTLMCGDGGNDVGALKQAHIGVALLGGFGSANADKSVTGVTKFQKVATAVATREELMKLHVSVLKKKLMQKQIDVSKCTEKKDYVELILQSEKPKAIEKKAPKKNPLIAKQPTPAERAEIMKKKQAEMEADVRAREARGESFARMKAIAAFARREAEEGKRLRAERTGSKGFANFANHAAMQQYMDDFEDGEVPMVKLGDASIASPFTSRAPSIKGCVDIIRQGRCALVTTVQMYQILAVNCLISSYSLSVLYLDKVKYANSQLMALGMISTVASITLSRATPLPNLSPVRPLTTIFHPALFLSLAGQFALHLGCMVYLTNLAKEYTDESDIVVAKPGEFTPNVMSTVIFLINGVQTVSVCAVNYKGRPFMKSMTDNPGLLYSLGISIVGVFLLLTEAMPLFNKVLQIVPMPDPRFARILTGMLALDVLGAFVWDQLCLVIFAPKIFIASMKSMTMQDIRQLIKMTVISLLIIYVLANIDYDEIERQQKLMEEAEVLKAAGSDSFTEGISQ